MPQKQAAAGAAPGGLQQDQYGRRNRSLAWLISGAAARVDAHRYSLSWEEEGFLAGSLASDIEQVPIGNEARWPGVGPM